MENFKEIIKQSETYKDVLIGLGLNINGTNYKKIKKIINEDNIDISHFLNVSDFLIKYPNPKSIIPLEDILVSGSTYENRGSLKRRLYKEGLKERKCELCHQGEFWNGKKMSLVLDHINGVNNDNRIENLRVVCPNCNATLDTHCGKNVVGKKTIRILNFDERQKKSLRKVERPSYEILLSEINKFGYCATGRKYGVSDNAIRKWVTNYTKL
jgi:hypothetical protein